MILYQYLCKMRPPAPGAVPKRNLHDAISCHMNFYNTFIWGMVEYTEPLTDEEIAEYELIPCGEAEKEDEK